jgi:hypothetical protein
LPEQALQHFKDSIVDQMVGKLSLFPDVAFPSSPKSAFNLIPGENDRRNNNLVRVFSIFEPDQIISPWLSTTTVGNRIIKCK